MERVSTGQIGQLIERANAKEPEVDFHLMQYILLNFGKIRELMLGAAIKILIRAGSLKDRIAAGKYDYVNEHIEKKFKLGVPEGEYEVVLFHANKVVTSEQAIEMMAEAGLEPALIDHGLAFGEQYPEVQREFPIVILGSIIELVGKRHVPCLYYWYVRRKLNLNWFDNKWHECYRFLALRKRSS